MVTGALSLRLIAVLLSVAYALVMASITLGITVTVTNASLRRLGAQHANALGNVTLTRLTAFFEGPSVHVDTLKNASRLYSGVSMGFNELQQHIWLDRTTFGMFAVPQSKGTNVFASDGTRIFSALYGFPTDVNQDRFAEGFQVQINGYATPGNFSSQWSIRNWNYGDALQPLSNATIDQKQIDSKGILSVLVSATLGGRATLWTNEPTLAVILNKPLLYATLVAPLHDAGKTLIGFAGPGITLNLLSAYLQQIQETPHSFGFIIDSSGFLLGTSCPIPWTNLTTSSTPFVPPPGCQATTQQLLIDENRTAPSVQYTICRTAAVDYAYAPFRAVMQDASLASAMAQTTAYKAVDGDDYFVASAPVTLRYPNLVLQLVITVPEVEVVGDLVGPRNFAIGVSVGVTVVLSAVIAAFVSVLFAPIGETAILLHDDPMASDLDVSLEDPLVRRSSLVEVQELQLSYQAMRNELRRIHAFVPTQAFSALPQPVVSDHYANDWHSPSAFGSEEATSPACNPLGLSLNAVDGDKKPLPEAAPDSARQSRRAKVRFVNEDGDSPGLRSVIEIAPLLSLRNVGVLFANVNGFQRWCVHLHDAQRQNLASAMTRAVSALVRDARDAIHSYGGAIQRFNGDQIEATFPSQVGSNTAYRRAVMSGVHLIQNTSDSDATAARVGLTAPLRWRVGVGFGSSVVGHAGSDSAQASHVIGAAWTHAAACQDLAKVYRVHGVLVNERIFALMQGEPGLEWRALGAHLLPGQTRKSVVVAVRRQTASWIEDYGDRARVLHNAVHFLSCESDSSKAVVVREALQDHLSDHHVSLEEWELRECLRWTDIPALEAVRGHIGTGEAARVLKAAGVFRRFEGAQLSPRTRLRF